MTKPNKLTNPKLATAYDLVIADLFSLLKKAPDQAKIKLGNLGTFQKKERILRSALNGKTYAYHQVNFKASTQLKKALDK